MIRGLVTRSQSGYYTVQTSEGRFTCQLRGKLKHNKRQGNILAVGDWVQLLPLSPKSGIIETIEARQRVFSRMAPSPQGEYEQILIANPDQVILVFACAKPAPRFGMVDRFLVLTEKQGTPAVIIANKTDLVGMEQARLLFDHYPSLGYPVFYTSVAQETGMDELIKILHGRLSLLVGPSGVGKTSLLNAIQPGLGLKVRQVSQATNKGRHTTVVREMFELEGGGYIADTPGLRALALWDVAAEELDGYFPELRPIVKDCQFSNCTHFHEPGCAVLRAVESGKVHTDRYKSYLRMRFGD